MTVHTEANSTPNAPVGLVLGTSPTTRGHANLFYTARIEAAARLYHAGKVQALIVSGDNSRESYNEPDAMRADLIAAGVPGDHVTCDYAGFRTLDSVLRARDVFGQNHFTVVSQPFHAERAVFLARRHGMRAQAFAARNPPKRTWIRFRAREVLARCLAVSDLLLGKGPKFLGPRVPVHLRNRP
ncbi:MAG: ElyC/SanA/YdcF family protein [Planctomycetota bacterium]|nr:ElyC/SanA/YdcF family protein [Planctomycetota bacterium]